MRTFLSVIVDNATAEWLSWILTFAFHERENEISLPKGHFIFIDTRPSVKPSYTPKGEIRARWYKWKETDVNALRPRDIRSISWGLSVKLVLVRRRGCWEMQYVGGRRTDDKEHDIFLKLFFVAARRSHPMAGEGEEIPLKYDLSGPGGPYAVLDSFNIPAPVWLSDELTYDDHKGLSLSALMLEGLVEEAMAA